MTQAAGGCGATCGIAPGCGRAATTATSAAPMLVRVAWRHSQELATGMMRVSRLDALVALAFCLVAGYFLADVWSRSRDTSPLAQICARIDYVNSLQEHLKDAASEEVQAELKALVEQCRTALRNRADEND